MRKFFILIFALVIASTAMAEEPRTVYCSLTASGLSYQFDYGQHERKKWLVDEAGNTLHFDTFVGALNFMSERGWRLVESYTTVKSNLIDSSKIESTTIWLLSKDVYSSEEITDGILTRQMFLERKAMTDVGSVE